MDPCSATLIQPRATAGPANHGTRNPAGKELARGRNSTWAYHHRLHPAAAMNLQLSASHTVAAVPASTPTRTHAVRLVPSARRPSHTRKPQHASSVTAPVVCVQNAARPTSAPASATRATLLTRNRTRTAVEPASTLNQ